MKLARIVPLIAIVAVCSWGSQAFAQVKIATVNAAKVFNEIQETKDLKSKMENDQKTLQAQDLVPEVLNAPSYGKRPHHAERGDRLVDGPVRLGGGVVLRHPAAVQQPGGAVVARLRVDARHGRLA